MLKEFKFGNFRSFKNTQILSMEPMGILKPELDCFNIAELKKERILKTAVIYGHNSFGKSNIFRAISEMQDIVENCTAPNFKINIDYFKLNNYSNEEPSVFELTMIINDMTYRYGFEIVKNRIGKEWLYRKNIREIKIFFRGNSTNDSIELNTSYPSLKKYIKFTRDEELFLSSMIKNNEQGEIKEIYNWIIYNIRVISGDMLDESITSELLADEAISKQLILRAIKNADINVSDIEILKEEKEFDSMPSFLKVALKEKYKDQDFSQEKFVKLNEIFKHSIFDKDKKKLGVEEFKLREKESQGTIKFYSLIGPILDSIQEGYTLFIDELDSKLHHLITKYIIDIFHDLSINTKNAQLIFNTHDIYLLKEDIFRKDQIYFTNKNEFAESEIYSLADFKGLDNKANILARYLAGNFGSLGILKSLELGD